MARPKRIAKRDNSDRKPIMRAKLDKQTRTRLNRECRLFARYLIGVRATREIARRYRQAHVHRFDELEPPSVALAYSLRHPRLLGFIESACGIARPEDVLRRKLLVMSAILETMPEHADLFLPRHIPLFPLLARLGWNSSRAIVKAAVGLFLLRFIVDPRPRCPKEKRLQ